MGFFFAPRFFFCISARINSANQRRSYSAVRTPPPPPPPLLPYAYPPVYSLTTPFGDPPPLPLLPHSHPPVYSLTTPFEQVFAIIVALTAQLAIAWGAYATFGVEDDLLEVYPEQALSPPPGCASPCSLRRATPCRCIFQSSI